MHLTRIEKLRLLLEQGLSPSFLVLNDDSAAHFGHGGWREGETTHVSVTIVSDHFVGLGRVARHRLIYSLVQSEIDAGLHALAIAAFSTQEHN